MKSPAWRFEDEAQDVAKIGSRKAFLVKSLALKFQDEVQRCDQDRVKKSFLGEISSLEIQGVAKIGSRHLSCVKVNSKMWPEGQESFLGKIPSLEISR